MKKTLLVFCALFFLNHQAEASEVFDVEGNRIFHVVDTGRTQEDRGLQNGRVVTTSYRLENLIAQYGQIFEYDYKWEVITSNGGVFMDYNYNKRQWKWVEGSGLRPSQSAKGDTVRRVYEEDELIDPVTKNYEGEYVYTTPEQGDRPFMTYYNGQFFNEFGEVVYTVNGPFKHWWRAIVVHHYYEEFYNKVAPAELERLRSAAADVFGNSNSIAQEMITIGNNSVRTFGGPFIMIYFVELEGVITILSETQIRKLKNKWLILNEKTRRGSAPRIIPEGGFYVKKKEARKRGIEGVSGKNFVLEIKIKTELIAEFKAEVLQN